MKRFFFLLALLTLLTGCRAPAGPLAYQCEAMRLRLTGQMDTLAYAAELTLEALPPEGEPDQRGFTLTYTAPASLCGLTLSRHAGELCLSRGQLTFDDPDGRFAEMALPAALFCMDSILQRADVRMRDGESFTRIETADDEGTYILWLDADGFPCRIEGRFGDRTVSADVLRQGGDDSSGT